MASETRSSSTRPAGAGCGGSLAGDADSARPTRGQQRAEVRAQAAEAETRVGAVSRGNKNRAEARAAGTADATRLAGRAREEIDWKEHAGHAEGRVAEARAVGTADATRLAGRAREDSRRSPTARLADIGLLESGRLYGYPKGKVQVSTHCHPNFKTGPGRTGA
jgi:hypothetical protein